MGKVALKIAQLAELAEAGFEPATHFSALSPAPCAAWPTPVSVKIDTRCFHSNTSNDFPFFPSRYLVHKAAW